MSLNQYEKRLVKAVEDLVSYHVFTLLDADTPNFSKEEAYSASEKVAKAASKRFKELLTKGR